LLVPRGGCAWQKRGGCKGSSGGLKRKEEKTAHGAVRQRKMRLLMILAGWGRAERIESDRKQLQQEIDIMEGN